MQQTLTAAMAIPPLLVVGTVAAVIGTPATLTLVGLVMIGVGLVTVYYA
jgi:Na+/phosphate symporter